MINRLDGCVCQGILSVRLPWNQFDYDYVILYSLEIPTIPGEPKRLNNLVATSLIPLCAVIMTMLEQLPPPPSSQ